MLTINGNANEDFTKEELDQLIGTYLNDGNIKILSSPVRNNLLDEFRCLANVNGMLCLIAIDIKKLNKD